MKASHSILPLHTGGWRSQGPNACSTGGGLALVQGEDILLLVGVSRPSRVGENLQTLDIRWSPEAFEALHEAFALGVIRGVLVSRLCDEIRRALGRLMGRPQCL